MKNQVARSKNPGDFPEPNDRLTYVLWKTQHYVERLLLKSLADMDLNLSHFGIMRHLSLTPGLTGAEIARRHDVTPQSISSAVADLRKRDLVRAATHPVHRGLVELELTDKGKKCLATAQDRVLAVEKEVSGHMSDRERETVLKTLIRVRDALRK